MLYWKVKKYHIIVNWHTCRWWEWWQKRRPKNSRLHSDWYTGGKRNPWIWKWRAFSISPHFKRKLKIIVYFIVKILLHTTLLAVLEMTFIFFFGLKPDFRFWSWSWNVVKSPLMIQVPLSIDFYMPLSQSCVRLRRWHLLLCTLSSSRRLSLNTKHLPCYCNAILIPCVSDEKTTLTRPSLIQLYLCGLVSRSQNVNRKENSLQQHGQYPLEGVYLGSILLLLWLPRFSSLPSTI